MLSILKQYYDLGNQEHYYTTEYIFTHHQWLKYLDHKPICSNIICKVLHTICLGNTDKYVLHDDNSLKHYAGYEAQELLLEYHGLEHDQNCTLDELIQWLYNYYEEHRSDQYTSYYSRRYKRWKKRIEHVPSCGLKREYIELSDKNYVQYTRRKRLSDIKDHFYIDWDYFHYEDRIRSWKRTKVRKAWMKHQRNVYTIQHSKYDALDQYNMLFWNFRGFEMREIDNWFDYKSINNPT